jgi:hypothetical protein
VREALATLPWVEKDTVVVKNKTVRFAVMDKKDFDLDAVKKALAAKNQNFKVDRVVSGP